MFRKEWAYLSFKQQYACKAFITMDESDVFKALIQLDPSKAQGYDNISPYVLKYCATSFTSPIPKLFTTFLTKSCLPQEWKMHKLALFLKRLISPMYRTITQYLCSAVYQKLWRVLFMKRFFLSYILNIINVNLDFYAADLAYQNFCLHFHSFIIL